MHRQFVAIDLFCGAGGMSLGLRDRGIHPVVGVDLDDDATTTYTHNLGVPALSCDIRDITRGHLDPFVPDPASVIIAACAPCQPFSRARKTKRRHEDGELLASVGRLVWSLRPEGVVIENVPEMASGHRSCIVARFRQRLKQAGYGIVDGILDAKGYGVPQTRRRYVLIAVRGAEQVTLPPPKRGGTLSVRTAIGDLPGIKAGETGSRRPLHRASRLSDLNLERIKAIPRDGGDVRSLPRRLRPKSRKTVDGFWDVYGRMAWDRPAPTLTTRCNSLSNGRFGHPDQDRAISLLEAAVLQTFPRGYWFAGNQASIARQIGNAVPRKLAAALGKQLRKYLDA
jgi:DNA (cytosine-5)-methyltransferase 1